MKPKPNLINIQDEYIAAINAGIARWAHRPKNHSTIGGGHADRIARGSRHKAEKQLRRIGFHDKSQINQALKDADDMATLLRNAHDSADSAE